MTKISVSIDEAQIVSGVGRTKLYEALNSGALKGHKLGKRTIILIEDLESYLSNLPTYDLGSYKIALNASTVNGGAK